MFKVPQEVKSGEINLPLIHSQNNRRKREVVTTTHPPPGNFCWSTRSPTVKCCTFLETSHDPLDTRIASHLQIFANYFATYFLQREKMRFIMYKIKKGKVKSPSLDKVDSSLVCLIYRNRNENLLHTSIPCLSEGDIELIL